MSTVAVVSDTWVRTGRSPPSDTAGATTITIARREDGSGYDCAARTGSKKWHGLVTLPFGIADDSSPAMFDQLAKMAAAQAIAEGFENWLVLDERDSGYLIRRREAYDAPVY